MTPRRATPSARTSAATSELGAFRGLAYALPLGALLWALLLGACATPDPGRESALRAYDLAVAHGLATERLEKPYARLRDGAPWTRRRGVEISR